MSGGDRELVKPLPAITKLPPHDKTELQKILFETPKKSWYHIFQQLSRNTKKCQDTIASRLEENKLKNCGQIFQAPVSADGGLGIIE